MTPEEAIALEPGTTPGPWHECDSPCTHDRCSDDTIIGPDVLGCDNPGFWVVEADKDMILAAPDMRATIAALRWEYGVEMDDVTSNPDPSNPGPRRWVQWCASEDYARTAVSAVFRQDRNPRLVRRIVGPVEVVEDV